MAITQATEFIFCQSVTPYGFFFNLRHYFGIIFDALAIIIMQLCYKNYALNTGEKFNLTFRSVADIHSQLLRMPLQKAGKPIQFSHLWKKTVLPFWLVKRYF